MKNVNLKTLLNVALLSLLLAGPAVAASGSEPVVAIKDPARTIAIHIGDVLTRQVTIRAGEQKIVPNSLPVKGTRTDGIELVDVKLTSEGHNGSTRHTLTLRYQVFADADTPLVMKLPAEAVQLSGGQEVAIPAWNFWFSPLVKAPLPAVLPNLQPQDKAPLIEIGSHQTALTIYLSVLLLGFVGAIYVNADRQWLPFMGGAFSRAHRSIKKLTRSREDDNAKVRQALLSLHQAFNQTYGRNLFVHDVDDFIRQNPGFAKLAADISGFFERSSETLFSKRKQDRSQLMASLMAFSKNLRDCERGV